jgi:hypothetical protein
MRSLSKNYHYKHQTSCRIDTEVLQNGMFEMEMKNLGEVVCSLGKAKKRDLKNRCFVGERRRKITTGL